MEKIGVAFTLFGKDIYWYGIIIAIGLVLGVWVAVELIKRKGYKGETILDAAIICVPMAIIFSRIYYVIFAPAGAFTWEQWWRVFFVWEGGLAIYGAVIGGVLGLFIFSKWRKVPLLDLLDVAAVGVILGQAIGRWGNFANQEAFGTAVTNPAMQWFPLSVYIERSHTVFDVVSGQNIICTNPWHFATFFYESIWSIGVFLFLFLWYSKRAKSRGNVFFMYLLLYGIGRTAIEWLRTDSLWIVNGAWQPPLDVLLRVSWLLSILLVITSTVILSIRAKKPIGFLTVPEKYARVGKKTEEQKKEE
ncbi:MAG: prolipoprotein diacylglyceryl transferase [Bacillota bacterium]|nr:prolipoprotein diacylglyceryl transferase [Bacillota bacterium]